MATTVTTAIIATAFAIITADDNSVAIAIIKTTTASEATTSTITNCYAYDHYEYDYPPLLPSRLLALPVRFQLVLIPAVLASVAAMRIRATRESLHATPCSDRRCVPVAVMGAFGIMAAGLSVSCG